MATPLPVFLAELGVAIKLIEPITTRITDKAGDQVKAEAQRIVRRKAYKTGALMRSIKNHGVSKVAGTITVNVTAGGPSSPHDVDYAIYVEEGTSRMGPRPYMRPALDKITPKYQKELADVMELIAAGRPGRVSGAIRRG